jgi:hypothetical protein
MEFSLSHEFGNRKTCSSPSQAVVANGPHGGCVLFYTGSALEYEICEAGLTDLSDLGLDDAPDGISIWKGVLRCWEVNTPDCHEYESELIGDFRTPTTEEWAAICQGKSPWSSDDWESRIEDV